MKRPLLAAAILMLLAMPGAAMPQWPIQCNWWWCQIHQCWELISCKWVGFIAAQKLDTTSTSTADTMFFKQTPTQSSPFDVSLRKTFAAQLPPTVKLASANHPEMKTTLDVWTDWLNSDGPGGKGDYELLANFAKDGRSCPTPVQIECRVAGVEGAPNSKNVYTCDKTAGSICENNKQSGGQLCQDHEVRFLCQVAW